MTSTHFTVRLLSGGGSRRLLAARVATSFALALGLGACGGGGDGIVEQRQQCTVTAVAVSPSATTLIVGDQTTLQSVPTSQNCTTTPATTWSSSSPNIATVNASSGAVTALTPGTATITATVGSASGTSVVTVRVANVGSIVITPPASIQVGQSLTLAFQVRDERGQTLTGRAVTFQTSAANIATVNGSGVVTGVGPGNAIITVTCEGVSQTVSVTITARPPASIRVTLTPGTTITPGTSTQAAATVLDSQGNVLAGESVTWTSTNPSAATVNTNSGLVTGVAAGQSVLRATSTSNPLVSKDTVITVNAPIPSTVQINLAATVNITLTATATATVRDAAGNVIPNANVTWSSSNPTVASIVSTTGLVSALQVGTTNIMVSVVGFPSVTRTQLLTVVAPVATVTIAQSNVLMEPGPEPGLTSRQLTVTLRDAAQNVLTGRTINYASSNNALATVTTSGQVNAGTNVGTGTITVTSEGVSSSVPFVVARAFAVVDANQPTNTSTYQPPQINSAQSTSTVTRIGVGLYTVSVAGIGVVNLTIGRSLTMFVNATNNGINSQLLAPSAVCNPIDWDSRGPTVVGVACSDPVSGAAKDAPFKLVVVGDRSVGGLAAFSFDDGVTGGTYTPLSTRAWNSNGAAMTISCCFAASDNRNNLLRHAMGISPGTQHALVSGLTTAFGQACGIEFQPSTAVVTDVVCYDRNGSINLAHTVLRLSSGRPGANGGLAFINALTGASFNQGFNSGGGSVTTSRSGVGKYTVVFGGMVATGAIGVVVSPFSAGRFAACSHYVVSLNPVTIDVSCFNGNGAFADAGTGLSVLVLQ